MKTKNINVWAIKLNNIFVELRATFGPAHIRVSLIKNHKINHMEYGYNWATCRYDIKRPTFDEMPFKQSQFIGGRFLGITRTRNLKVKFSRNNDVTKLTPAQAKVVLDRVWRKRNL